MSDDAPQRPRTRGDCAAGPRPCPWVSCRHHLAVDISPGTGRITRARDPMTMAETCALDVADRGPHMLDEVGQILDVSRERVRQIEERALLWAIRCARIGQLPELREQLRSDGDGNWQTVRLEEV